MEKFPKGYDTRLTVASNYWLLSEEESVFSRNKGFDMLSNPKQLA